MMRSWWVLSVAAACGGGSSKIFDAPEAPIDAAVDAPVDATVTVTLTTAIGTAQQDLAFVAGQDGDGPWQALTGTGGVYGLAVTTGRFAFAYTCPGGAAIPEVGLFAAATSELSSRAVSCAPTTTVTVSGSVTNVPNADTADVSFGSNVVEVGQPGPTITYVHAIPSGRYSVGIGFEASPNVGAYTQFIVDRGVDVVADTSRNYDFGNAFALETRTIAVDNSTVAEQVTSFTGLLTDSGYVATGGKPNPLDVHNVPAAQLQGNDLVVLGGAGSDAVAMTTRSNRLYEKHPDDVALLLPDLVTPSVSISSTSPVQFRADLGHTPGSQAHYVVAGQSTVRWSIVVTAGWFGTATDRVYTTPDLTGVPGWDSAQDLVAGASITYDLTNAACNHSVVDLLNEGNASVTVDGLSTTSAQHHGQIIP